MGLIWFSKKQRFKILESEITELQSEVSELKLIVHELRERKPSVFATMVGQDLEAEYAEQVKQEVQHQTVQCSAARPPIEEVGQAFFEAANKVLNPKTPNQLRAEIIEKAKGFVDKHLTSSDYGYGVVGSDTTPKTRVNGPMEYKLVVNEEERTIEALGKLYWTGVIKDKYKGIAKCNPSDVFNEHIGKAIALGRGLGLDVSEFEQVVQPTVAVGQKFKVTQPGRLTGKVVEITNMSPRHDNLLKYGLAFNYDLDPTFWLGEKQGKIINDTNAIYGA